MFLKSKKSLCLILALVCIFGLFGCSLFEKEPDEADETDIMPRGPRFFTLSEFLAYEWETPIVMLVRSGASAYSADKKNDFSSYWIYEMKGPETRLLYGNVFAERLGIQTLGDFSRLTDEELIQKINEYDKIVLNYEPKKYMSEYRGYQYQISPRKTKETIRLNAEYRPYSVRVETDSSGNQISSETIIVMHTENRAKMTYPHYENGIWIYVPDWSYGNENYDSHISIVFTGIEYGVDVYTTLYLGLHHSRDKENEYKALIRLPEQREYIVGTDTVNSPLVKVD